MEPDEAISQYAEERGIHWDLLRRWQGLSELDRGALLETARTLRLGQNHLRDVLDWCIEISRRDDVPIASILNRDEVALVVADSRLGRNDKIKHVKASLRQLRYPRLTRIEGEVRKRLRALKTDPRISFVVSPGLEGGVKVEFSARDAENLERLALEVASLARREDSRELFDLLSGNEDASLSTR